MGKAKKKRQKRSRKKFGAKSSNPSSRKIKQDETSSTSSEQNQHNQTQPEQEPPSYSNAASTSSLPPESADVNGAEIQQARGTERQINQQFDDVNAKTFCGSAGFSIHNEGTLNIYMRSNSKIPGEDGHFVASASDVPQPPIQINMQFEKVEAKEFYGYVGSLKNINGVPNVCQSTSCSKTPKQGEMNLTSETASIYTSQMVETSALSGRNVNVLQSAGPQRDIFTNMHTQLQFCENTHVHMEEYITSQRETEKKFLDIFEMNTERETRDKVTATFVHLNVPDKQVNPKFHVVDFYRGDIAPESGAYIPDIYYHASTKRLYTGQTIQIEQFLDKSKHAVLVAGAGEGKTNAAKRFARMVLKKQIPSLSHIKLVHFIRIASLDPHKEYTVFDLLFNQTMGPALDKKLRAFGHAWVQENAAHILLVLDGLDQAVWKPDGVKSIPRIAYNRKASASVIIYNIMNEGLLGDCKVVLTSRPHAITHFHFDKDENKTIALTGLSEDDTLYLIRALAGNESQAIEDYLKLSAPGILPLCRCPMNVVFTVAVYLLDPKNPPQTFTNLLISVLDFFLLSENRRERHLLQILYKLKKLSYNGTMARKVLFTKQEIEDVGLTTDRVSDVVLVTPLKRRVLHFHIMEEGAFFRLHFCHEAVQEALCALYILTMPIEEFHAFVFENLDDFQFEVVKRILVGILFDPDISSLYDRRFVIGNIPNVSEKKHLLKRWMIKRMGSKIPKIQTLKDSNRKSKDSKINFSTCSLLSECGKAFDEILPQSVHKVDCSGRWELEDDELCKVALVAKWPNHISEVKFGHLKPNRRTASILADSLRDKLVMIKQLTCLEGQDDSYNVNVMIRTLSKMHVMQLKINTLDFSNNSLKGSPYLGIRKMLCRLRPGNLDLSDCDLTGDKIHILKQIYLSMARDQQIKLLDISSYKKESDLIEEELNYLMYQLGEFICVARIEEVRMNGYKISPKSAERLFDGTWLLRTSAKDTTKLLTTKFITKNGEYSVEDVRRMKKMPLIKYLSTSA